MSAQGETELRCVVAERQPHLLVVNHLCKIEISSKPMIEGICDLKAI